jgi:hypothetical protein
MAKSTIRKNDPENTSAPERRRKAAPAAAVSADAAVPKTPRSRRRSEMTAEPGAGATAPVTAAEPVATAWQANGNGYAAAVQADVITPEQIAERAYYIFLERGGRPGDQFADWVQAERQLREQLVLS